MTTKLLIIAVIFVLMGLEARAESKADAGAKKAKEDIKEQTSETQHSVVIGGTTISYTATAGTFVMKDENGKAKASIFYIAYTKDGVKDPATRPLTFSFNGGPGSSSVWLHLGVLGPKRVFMDPDGNPPPPPYRLVDNEFSLLDDTDLVFIDPVSTGYSRAVAGEDPKNFHGLEKDIASVGEFIRLYTTRKERWASPKFLVGESYGTTRAAGLSQYLQNRCGMYLNGIMLVSAIMNFQTARFQPGNDLPYILFLPTYTATAWYHKRLGPEYQTDLRATLDKVEEFAYGDYADALMKGAALEASERSNIARQLSEYTGLSPAYLEQTDLRINIFRFTKELMRDKRRTVGRLDSRFIGIDSDAAGESLEYDPSYAAIQGPYTACLNDYVRRELKFESDLPYEILTGRVRPWDYSTHQNRFVNVAERLRESMTKNPFLKVYVANGYYDLATPYFATEYTIDHLGLDPSLRANISMHYYESGHMMYIHIPSLQQQKADISGFIKNATQR